MTVQCQNCPNVVSDDYARVCGDNQGRVYQCPNCAKREGGGAMAHDPDADGRGNIAPGYAIAVGGGDD